ncbi:uncharacterized protein J3D65DRAFT_310521 [Phyllosticta citribraziliensis]|uniref:Uncharacterized protein n=1 Tax=Phyllosticta citribraziliensis TaxID=989973 RepID=A0ABR1LY18_9PEZI
MPVRLLLLLLLLQVNQRNGYGESKMPSSSPPSPSPQPSLGPINTTHDDDTASTTKDDHRHRIYWYTPGVDANGTPCRSRRVSANAVTPAIRQFSVANYRRKHDCSPPPVESRQPQRRPQRTPEQEPHPGIGTELARATATATATATAWLHQAGMWCCVAAVEATRRCRRQPRLALIVAVLFALWWWWWASSNSTSDSPPAASVYCAACWCPCVRCRV